MYIFALITLIVLLAYFTIDMKFILEQILLAFGTSEHYKRKRKDLKGLSFREREI